MSSFSHIEDKLLECRALVKILKLLKAKSLSFVIQPMIVVDSNNECGIMALWVTGDAIAGSVAMTATLIVSQPALAYSKASPSKELCIMSNDKTYVTCNISDIEKFIGLEPQSQMHLSQDFSTQFIPNMYKLVDAIDYALSNGYNLSLAHTVDLRILATIAKAGQSLEEAAIMLELTV